MTRGLVVVAAGSATRMGGVDKMWADLGGRPLVEHSLVRLGPTVDAIALVVREEDVERAREAFCYLAPSLTVVAGGPERQDSVQRGVATLAHCDVIAVHDGARPFAGPDLIETGVALLSGAEGAVPVEPVRDTIKRVGADEQVVATVDRESLRAAQTPQVFKSAALLAAFAACREGRIGVTDDASLLERVGLPVRAFAGRPGNFKITTAFDLHLARLLVANS